MTPETKTEETRARTAEAQPSSAPATGYTAVTLLQILCECRRNITNAQSDLDDGKFDMAAAQLESASSKLRTIQTARDEAV